MKLAVVTDFFLERYQPFTEKDGIFMFINNNFNDYTVTIGLSIETNYLLAIYSPAANATKTIGLTHPGRYRSLIDYYLK
ncbi:MAG: hypothetical protein WCR36_10385 [Bacteroidaceae bacterium]